MKDSKFLIALLVTVFFVACKTENKETKVDEKTIAEVTSDVMESAVIYEANIRQYSPEGTFNAFAKDIPVLKELGVKVIWVMPINPISQIKRKATDGSFTSDIEDEEERKKYLGSYYSVSDYKAINPEFGTMDDFKNLVRKAHENGIYVIVDWVPNHTGWDHPWIAAHPQWYTQNDKGEIIDPINPDTGESWGWTDVADLNYDNQDMRKEMISDMKFWVETADIDGFRMDVAHKVPPAFFDAAIKEMKTVKPLFMLAEAEQQELFRKGYDMQYAWEGHHLLNQIAKGEKSVADFDAYMIKQDTVMQNEDYKMNFVTNHDENSWNGTLNERMPNSKELFTALTYTIPGMPLIYSGQEYDMNHRLKFFEKDEIPKTKGEYFEFLKKLGQLKNENPALHGGVNAASYKRINTNNKNILAFSREKDGNEVLFVGNLSNNDVTFTTENAGTYKDCFTGDTYLGTPETEYKLSPWQYVIMANE